MKKKYIFLLALLMSSLAHGQFFTSGNLIVFRVGDGSAALTSAATPIFLDEYTPTGTLVQTVASPTSVSGSNKAVTCSGTATSEGLITLSSDGKYIFFTGYNAAPGTASVAGTSSASVNRVAARLDFSGAINSTTALTDFSSGSNARGVFSSNGTDIWVSGGTGGVRYTTLGATTSTQLITTPANIRMVNAFNSQLYFTASSGTFFGISAIGSGMPVTGGQTATILPGFPVTTGPSPYGFCIKPVTADIAYVADDRALASGGGIQKWVLNSGTWSLSYVLTSGLTVGARNVTVDWSGTNPVIYFTDAASKLMKVTDAGSGSVATLLATAPTNTAFRGVAFTPQSVALPVKLDGIKALQMGSACKIMWTNLTESNIEHYIVERSLNGIRFDPIATIPAVINNGTLAAYDATDPNPARGNNFYRIGVVDRDGKWLYSPIVKLHFNMDQPALLVMPNPVRGRQINLQVTALTKGSYQIQLVNAAGIPVFHTTMEHRGGNLTSIIALPGALTAGVYYLELYGEAAQLQTKISIR